LYFKYSPALQVAQSHSKGLVFTNKYIEASVSGADKQTVHLAP